MKTNPKLENFIQENRADFDFSEVPADLFSSIEKKLPKAKKQKSILPKYWMAYAASLLFVFAFYWIFNSINVNSKKSNQLTSYDYSNLDPAMVELIETESFYKNRIAIQYDSLQKLTANQPELSSDIKEMMKQLDESYKNMSLDLKENIDKEVVMSAMINHQRLKLQTINEMIDEIKTSNL